MGRLSPAWYISRSVHHLITAKYISRGLLFSIIFSLNCNIPPSWYVTSWINTLNLTTNAGGWEIEVFYLTALSITKCLCKDSKKKKKYEFRALVEWCWQKKTQCLRKEKSPRTTSFTINSIILHVDTVAMGQIFFQVLQFPPVSIFSPVLHSYFIHLSSTPYNLSNWQSCSSKNTVITDLKVALNVPVWYNTCICRGANKLVFNSVHNRI
jgi:hypothetical protein